MDKWLFSNIPGSSIIAIADLPRRRIGGKWSLRNYRTDTIATESRFSTYPDCLSLKELGATITVVLPDISSLSFIPSINSPDNEEKIFPSLFLRKSSIKFLNAWPFDPANMPQRIFGTRYTRNATYVQDTNQNFRYP